MAVIDNLVAYWSLEETSGTRVDGHGANDLTDNNTVTSTTGKVGTAASFAVANLEYLSIADNADVSAGDVDFSLAAWVYVNANATARTVHSKWDDGSNNEHYLVLASDHTTRWRCSSDGSTTSADVSGGVLSTSAWHFVVCWHDATANTVNLQVDDGTVYNATLTTGIYDGTAAFQIGARASGYNMDGAIDETGFWKKVLSAAERTWLYNSGNGRSYADIVAESGGIGGSVFRGRALSSLAFRGRVLS